MVLSELFVDDGRDIRGLMRLIQGQFPEPDHLLLLNQTIFYGGFGILERSVCADIEKGRSRAYPSPIECPLCVPRSCLRCVELAPEVEIDNFSHDRLIDTCSSD